MWSIYITIYDRMCSDSRMSAAIELIFFAIISDYFEVDQLRALNVLRLLHYVNGTCDVEMCAYNPIFELLIYVNVERQCCE